MDLSDKSLQIVKIGGAVIDSPSQLDAFLDDFAMLPGPKILVHGGGRAATSLSKTLNIPTTMIEGRRVTDRATLDVVTMVYAGLINKNIVAALQKRGCNAMGLTGADGNSIKAHRRNPHPIDYGYVGDIYTEGVNVKLIQNLLNEGVVPVFCAITHDAEGSLLNCNADTIASSLAVAMSKAFPTRLIYCFEQPGVLADVDNPESVISEITPSTAEQLKADGTLSGGMIPKIDNALKAVEKGVKEVVIKSASTLSAKSGTAIHP